MRTRIVRLMLSSLLVALIIAGAVGPQRPAVASDHDEAPLLSMDFVLNATDVYAFIEPGTGTTVVSNPVLIGVPDDLATFNDADTIFHFDQFIEPGIGSGTVGFEFSAFRFRSTQALALAFSNGNTAQFDVEVMDSPTTPSTGTAQVFENTAGTGGSVVLDITLYLLMTFTNTITGEVTVVDGGTENLPIQVEGSASYSYSCPPDFLSIPEVTANLCLGHFPGASSVFPTTLIDINNTSDPALVWRVRPATAPANNPPVLNEIGTLEANEGVSTTLHFSATDLDGDNLSFSIQNAPSYSTFFDNGDGTATLIVTPPVGSSPDIFSVTVTVTDSGSPPLSDQETFALRITPGTGNIPPVLNPIGDQTVREFESSLIPGLVEATDENGDTITLTVEGLPTACAIIESFSVPGQVIAELKCDPAVMPGEYTVTVTAHDGDLGIDTKTFTLTVEPFLDAGGDRTLNQGEQIELAPNTSAGATIDFDFDGDSVFETPGPTAVFDASGLAIGDYDVGVRATKNGVTATDTITVTVVVPNLPPTFEYTGPSTVVEGGTLNAVLTITDPEGVDISSLNVTPSNENHPCSLTINSEAGPGLATIAFDCATEVGDEGEYEFVITAGDGENTATTTVVITVLHANAAPTLTPIDDVTLDEGAAVTVPVSATDADGNNLTITASGAPTYGSFVDNEDGTGLFTFNPNFEDAGTTTITVRVTDDGDPNLFDEETFTVTVLNVNQGPVLDPIGDLNVNVGETGTLSVNASDPDGDNLLFTADLPAFCLLNDNGSGSADIQCNPDEDDAGDHEGLVTVTDDGDPALIDSTTITIRITTVNNAPTIDSISGQTTIDEGQTTTLQVTASDPNGDSLTMTLEGNPSFCTIVDNGGGSATITCNPEFNDSGTHMFRVFASDEGEPQFSTGATITLVVVDVNRPPVMNAIEDQTVVEDGNLFGTFSATDPDGAAITFSSLGLPDFCALTDNGDGTASFECDPEIGDAGQSIITITASDGVQQTTRSFRLTVQPKISLNVPSTANDGEFVQLDADCQSCGDGDTEYAWDFNGDDVFDDAVGPNPTVDTATLVLGENALAVQGCLPGAAICNTASATLWVEPTLVVDGLFTIFTERTTTITANTSRDSDLFTYEWDLDGDSEFDDAIGQSLDVDTSLLGTGNYNWSVQAFLPVGSFIATSDFAFEVVDADGVTAGGPYATAANVAIEVIAGCPPCGDNTVSWLWDLDNDGQGDATGQTSTFTSDTPGEHIVTVTACLDGVVDPASCETAETTVDVESGNRPPVLEPIGPQDIPEGDIIDRPLFASDPDGDQVTISGIDLPSFCQIELTGDGEVYLLCTPGQGDAGEYTFTIVAQDDGNPALQDTETVTLTVRPTANAGGPYTVTQGSTTNLSATGPVEFEYVWDLDGDTVFEASGQTVTFDATTLAPGAYPVRLQVCLTDGLLCNEDDTEVIVEGPSIETYDELESLVRAFVDNPFVERILTAALNLAQYFDEELGLDAVARALLRSFIRLVEGFTPFFIDPDEAQQLIDFAESLLEDLAN